ncbi:cell wall hydrolase [Erythrobacter fulvus]|uniref:cell wall hydrolase n=1 Tax=Erythrobacter fulvus TaxID=2987523 RepID=UPI0028690CF3|nr:cell wall hydrolase [Erythrobacter fulvus]
MLLLLSLFALAPAPHAERTENRPGEELWYYNSQSSLSAPASKVDAATLNDAVRSSPQSIVPANPWRLGSAGVDEASRLLAIDCLTAAIYYEAAHEPLIGQRAVAQVVLNRLRHPAFPSTVCGVVFQGSERDTGCQFTFTCDGALERRPAPAGWLRAQGVAAAALGGFVELSVGHATHYHAVYVHPRWTTKLMKLKTIGSHIFYQWPGRSSSPEAFSDRYGGSETVPAWASNLLRNKWQRSLDTTLKSAIDETEASLVSVQERPNADPASSGPAGYPSETLSGRQTVESTPRLNVASGKLKEPTTQATLIESRRELKD